MMMTTDFKNSFSQWLHQALQASGMSQSELARAAGVSKQHINGFLALAQGRYVQRSSLPSIEVVDSIARALGASVNDARLSAGYAPVTQDPKQKESPVAALLFAYNDLSEQDKAEIQVVIDVLRAEIHRRNLKRSS